MTYPTWGDDPKPKPKETKEKAKVINLKDIREKKEKKES